MNESRNPYSPTHTQTRFSSRQVSSEMKRTFSHRQDVPATGVVRGAERV